MIVNFRDEILEAAEGEPIEAIRISNDPQEYLYYDDKNSNPRKIDSSKLNVNLPWEEAAPLLNYTHNNGYGGQECHDIIAWTKNKVLFVHEYDGSTCVQSVYRNPPKKGD